MLTCGATEFFSCRTSRCADEQEVKLGDTERPVNDAEGQVICSIDNDEYGFQLSKNSAEKLLRWT
jgi:hypothetical protein